MLNIQQIVFDTPKFRYSVEPGGNGQLRVRDFSLSGPAMGPGYGTTCERFEKVLATDGLTELEISMLMALLA